MPSNGWKTIWVNRSSQKQYLGKLLPNSDRNKKVIRGKFNAIVGYKGNGAIVHYHPDHHHSAEIKPEGHLTDRLWRTVPRWHYRYHAHDCIVQAGSKSKKTLYPCIKGHIALARAIFPEGSCGHNSMCWQGSFCGNTDSITSMEPAMAWDITSMYTKARTA